MTFLSFTIALWSGRGTSLAAVCFGGLFPDDDERWRTMEVPPQGFEHIELQTTDTAKLHTCGQTNALTLTGNILPFGFLTIIIRKPSRQ
ncbi:hypothetical protein [Bifidobacterium stellenboschense]|uniref:hypothetical protein n=1 Tax=Bifidobacterium stellenboschense TaxID=762211 RepID=UPI0012EB3E78|nr:hypothetical protein [Bifidobacterium stellenboschense]